MKEPNNLIEVEAKLWVSDQSLLPPRLKSAGAVLIRDRVFERNIRYETAGGALTPNGIVLRLRQDDRVRLTYKGPLQDQPELPDGLQRRFEAEVTVDDFATMDIILTNLGYRPFMAYEKYRTTYLLQETEVVLDEMPYGHFVEVEGQPDRIEAVITELGLAENLRFSESYARLFDHVRANLKLTFNDLTFENFAGIDVPLHAFAPPV